MYFANVSAIAQITTVSGDANFDGAVILLDLITIANTILNFNPQPFCFNNADVNPDRIINLLDMIGTVSVILN